MNFQFNHDSRLYLPCNMPKPGSRFFKLFYAIYLITYWTVWIIHGRVNWIMWALILPVWALGWPTYAMAVPTSAWKGAVLLGHGLKAFWKWLLIVDSPKPKDDWKTY